jgi:hypothetical protein
MALEGLFTWKIKEKNREEHQIANAQIASIVEEWG